MIDPNILRNDPDRVRRSQQVRGASPDLVDQWLAADEARRAKISTFETLRSQQKEIGRSVAKAQGEEKQALIAQTKQLAQDVKDAQAAADQAQEQCLELMKAIGNIVIEDVPVGGEEDFVILEQHGSPRDFEAEGFTPRDNVELGELLGAVDMERGAKVSGSRFYYLTGQGALLEFALSQFALNKALEWGFTPMIPPALVLPKAMDGTGFLGQAAQDVYHLEQDDMYLVGTAEVPLAAYHSDEIIPESQLPLHYAGFSPAYRREAGSYGKDTRGIFRVHWFDKWEMFVYCDPKDAEKEHQRLLEFEKSFIEDLELPYQVLDVASGDLGLSAARKYDCYTWLPSQQRYREITSTSNCTEFQARRLNIRMRDGEGVRSVATLNGTLCAMTRMIIAILENHQQKDGSVRIPEKLRPFIGGREALVPVKPVK